MAEATKTEFKVSARRVRMSARKARLVMNAVRGRNALEAVTLLQFVNKRAAPQIMKLIDSAIANAEEYGNREGVDVDPENFVISEARVDEGQRWKRWRPRSRGMANPYTRYTCHMHITLTEADALEERAEGKPAWRKPRKRMSREERLRKVGRESELGKAETQPAKAEKAEKTAAVKEAAEKKTENKTEKKAEKKQSQEEE